MKNLLVGSVCSVLTLFSTASFSQEEKSIATELELGAIITSGNTEDENIKYGLTIDWDRGDWDYRFSSDGFRSSRESDLTAQRLYHVANADYTFDAASFIKTRLAYEDDRFSGFESQSDFTINYGRKLLLDRIFRKQPNSCKISVLILAAIATFIVQRAQSKPTFLTTFP